MLSPSCDRDFDTIHRLVQGNLQLLDPPEDGSVHLVVTAPPAPVFSKDLTELREGSIEEYYQDFLEAISKTVGTLFRLLAPGGRLACIVEDIWLHRKDHGRHQVLPFQADLSIICRNTGFENLSPILAFTSDDLDRIRILGTPYQPNGIIANHCRFILLQRKPGGYRKPTAEQRLQSRISKENYEAWFRQTWFLSNDTEDPLDGYPMEIADRLIRMFSFSGDTVLDPFCRTGTTLIAAMLADRNSIGIEADDACCRIALNRLHEFSSPLFGRMRVEYDPNSR